MKENAIYFRHCMFFYLWKGVKCSIHRKKLCTVYIYDETVWLVTLRIDSFDLEEREGSTRPGGVDDGNDIDRSISIYSGQTPQDVFF